MHLLSDQALFAAAHPSLPPANLSRLRQLNHTAGERTLTGAEVAEQAALLEDYHFSVLRLAARRWRLRRSEVTQSLIELHSRPASMTSPSIPKAVREQVKQRAGFRCEYCQTSEWLHGIEGEIDHIIPV